MLHAQYASLSLHVWHGCAHLRTICGVYCNRYVPSHHEPQLLSDDNPTTQAEELQYAVYFNVDYDRILLTAAWRSGSTPRGLF